MTTILIIVAYAALSTLGILFLRSALEETGSLSVSTLKTLLSEPRFLLGFLFYAASFATWLLALRRHEVSRIFPAFVGAGYCAVVAGAYLFLNESPTPSRLAGIAVILAGIALVLR